MIPIISLERWNMSALSNFKKKLRPGGVYRRAELHQWSNAVDRHLGELLSDGTLVKVSRGLYMRPKETRFGKVNPDTRKLVESFLKDDRFLLVSSNLYNGLGVGTTQLYNETVVYNKKRHGKFMLGSTKFYFRHDRDFPKTLTKEFLLVDLVNNLKTLAEEQSVVLEKAQEAAKEMHSSFFSKTLKSYGKNKTKKLLGEALGVAA